MDHLPFWWQGCHLILDAPKPGPAWWMTPVLSALLAVIGAVGGSWIAIAFDRRKSINQELIKKRLELYSTYVPMANDIYCYLWRIGNFRSFAPADILSHKRKLDSFIHIYGALFDDDALSGTYHEFIGTCFKAFGGTATSAKIRADPATIAKQFGAGWNPQWDSAFNAAEACDRHELDKAYEAFTNAFALQVGAKR